MKLEKDKKYRTRGGWLATCIYTELKRDREPVVMVHHVPDGDDIVWCHHPDGAFSHEQTDFDLVAEAKPWDEFKIDDPVMAYRESWNGWRPRHFAGVINGIPYVFLEGATSWTTRGATLPCESVRLPTEAELKGGVE